MSNKPLESNLRTVKEEEQANWERTGKRGHTPSLAFEKSERQTIDANGNVVIHLSDEPPKESRRRIIIDSDEDDDDNNDNDDNDGGHDESLQRKKHQLLLKVLSDIGVVKDPQPLDVVDVSFKSPYQPVKGPLVISIELTCSELVREGVIIAVIFVLGGKRHELKRFDTVDPFEKGMYEFTITIETLMDTLLQATDMDKIEKSPHLNEFIINFLYRGEIFCHHFYAVERKERSSRPVFHFHTHMKRRIGINWDQSPQDLEAFLQKELVGMKKELPDSRKLNFTGAGLADAEGNPYIDIKFKGGEEERVNVDSLADLFGLRYL